MASTCFSRGDVEMQELMNFSNSGEQYGNPDDYPSDQEYDYVDTLETVRRTTVRPLLPPPFLTLISKASTVVESRSSTLANPPTISLSPTLRRASAERRCRGVFGYLAWRCGSAFDR